MMIKEREQTEQDIRQSSAESPTFKVRANISQEIRFTEEVTCLECYDNMLYVGTSDSKVIVYEMTYCQYEKEPIKLKYISNVYPHCSWVSFIVATEKFLIMIPYKEQQLIRVWNRDPLKIMHGFRGHEHQITDVIFMQDGQHLASSSYDFTVRIWNIYDHGESNKEKVRFQGPYPILTLKEIDDHNIVFGGDSCFITIWNWKENEIKYRAFGHPGSILSVNYKFPYLMSSGGDSKIKIWEVRVIKKSIRSQGIELKISRNELVEVYLVKQVKDKLKNRQFYFQLSKQQMVLLDTAGDIFLVDFNLNFKMGKIPLEYNKEIISARIWKEYLLFFSSYQPKEQRTLSVYPMNSIQLKERKIVKEINGQSTRPMILDFPVAQTLMAESIFRLKKVQYKSKIKQ